MSVEVKDCRRCRVVKAAGDFTPDRNNRDGLKSYCRPCAAERRRDARKRNPAHFRSLDAAWRAAHPRPSKPRRTPEPGSPEWAARKMWTRRICAARAHAKQWQAPVNDLRLADWLAVLEEHNRCCTYCGSPDRIEIEHVIPIYQGGGNTRSNVVPACHACNFRKSRRTAEQFAAGVCLNGHER